MELKNEIPVLDFPKHFMNQHELFFDSHHLDSDNAILSSGLAADFILEKL